MIFEIFRNFSKHYSIAFHTSGSEQVLSLLDPKSTQYKQVVCDNSAAHASHEPVPSGPGATEQAKSPLEHRDVGFDTGPEVPELFVNPGAFHHLKDRYPFSFGEGDILYPIGFSGFEVCLGSKPTIGSHLPGKPPIDLFLPVHKGHEHRRVGRVAALDRHSRG